MKLIKITEVWFNGIMHPQLFRCSLFFIVALIIFIYLSFHFGLLQHWLVKGQIAQLTGIERETAESEFYALGKAGHLLAGTLAKISLRDEDGVWVWSNQGLKYFPADEYTFYSYYDICAAISN